MIEMFLDRRNKPTNLHHEADKGEWVVVEHDAANVADNLTHTAHEHTRHETPALPANAQEYVCNTDQGEEDGKGDVGGERGAESVDAPFCRAVGEGAVGVAAKGDVARVGTLSCHCE